jgi:tetratricopeptide (TPR) repeat protein
VTKQALAAVFDLKPLKRKAIPDALEKARHYRLLNEPLEAESICLDILELEPDHEDALIALVLALTDQFDQRLKQAFKQATSAVDRLGDPYDTAYYKGLVCERRAKVHLSTGGPGSGHVAYSWFRRAMELYEFALELRPEAPDPILRWNTCVRTIERTPALREEPDDRREHFLE